MDSPNSTVFNYETPALLPRASSESASLLAANGRMQTTSSYGSNDGSVQIAPTEINAESASSLPEDDVGGGKDISFFGGLALLVNSLTGPGIVALPGLVAAAGWFPVVVALVFISGVSSLSSILLCIAMSKVPGNDNFQGRVEFSTLAKYFLPRPGYLITLFLLISSLVCSLLSSIVLPAQTMDLALIAVFGKSYALEIFKSPGILVATGDGEALSPFGDSIVLSLGYIIVLTITIPFGMFNLDENIVMQIGSMTALFAILVEWFINFFFVGMEFSTIPFIGNNQKLVLGTVIFNYAFVTTVPSWVNEKKDSVSVRKSIWSATTIATLVYILIGLCGAAAFDFRKTQDLVSTLDGQKGISKALKITTKVAVYLFPIASCLTSIPVFSIVIKYNLVANKLCRKRVATFWAVVFPWVLAVAFYSGSTFLNLINWASLMINGFINFVIPLLIFVIAHLRPPVFSIQQDEHEISHLFEPVSRKRFYQSIMSLVVIFILTALCILSAVMWVV